VLHLLRIVIKMTHLCMIALPCITTNAFAEGVDVVSLKTNWGVTLGGAATTIAIHELGHFVVAGIEDADAYFDGLTVICVYPQLAFRPNGWLQSTLSNDWINPA